MTETFDFVIIGAGSGGLIAADFAAKLGVRVALLEKHQIGGDCTWTGCIPSKALLKVARVAHTARNASSFGIETETVRADMSTVRDYVKGAIEAVYQFETPERLAKSGIQVIFGPAMFLDSHTLMVGDRKINAGKILIATGAKPALPPVVGIDSVPHFTYENIFENTILPKHLVVLGAGPIGVEIAQAYRRLGSEVTIVDVDLLPEYERDAASALKSVFVQEGIRFVPGLCLSADESEGAITINTGSQTVRGDKLLVATGRQPRIDGLNLEKSGVRFSEEGIEVNKYLRTNIKHIYAAGDVTGGPQFTHVAGWQGFIAARNALLPGNENGTRQVIPATIFTDPEIAQVGLTEPEARHRFGDEVRIKRMSMLRSDRSITENSRDGFIKLIFRSNGKILGATIVSERAGETINEIVLAMENGIRMKDLARTIHVYPSFAVDAMRLAADASLEDLTEGLSGSFVRGLARFATTN
jgi:pyruvate/2-oxoglutarate dehydrogenase complex dihydrolipoamide dehydrogenase (E3) component